jgi:hypothetical protein
MAVSGRAPHVLRTIAADFSTRSYIVRSVTAAFRQSSP